MLIRASIKIWVLTPLVFANPGNGLEDGIRVSSASTFELSPTLIIVTQPMVLELHLGEFLTVQPGRKWVSDGSASYTCDGVVIREISLVKTIVERMSEDRDSLPAIQISGDIQIFNSSDHDKKISLFIQLIEGDTVRAEYNLKENIDEEDTETKEFKLTGVLNPGTAEQTPFLRIQVTHYDD